MSNRALLMAGFSSGRSRIGGLLLSDDVTCCQNLLRQLGIRQEQERVAGPQVWVVDGCGGRPPAEDTSLWCGDAGTLARFVPGMLAAAPSGKWYVDASLQLRRRPLQPLLTALADLGAQIDSHRGGLPMSVAGGGLSGGCVRIAADVSSQFVSGLLLAAACSIKPTQIALQSDLVQPAYVDMTVRVLRDFGAHVQAWPSGRGWDIWPTQLQGRSYHIEADASTACYFWAAAAATGGAVTVGNLDETCGQADMALLPILRAMGCQVIGGAARAGKVQNASEAIQPAGEPIVSALPGKRRALSASHAWGQFDKVNGVDGLCGRKDGGITVTGPGQLRGNMHTNLHDFSDQMPTVLALAALADGPVTVSGVAHIRFHESDRIKAMACVIKSLGGSVQEHADGVTVWPVPLQGRAVHVFSDHRIAMATAIIGLRVPNITIENPSCVSKTCPQFFSMLAELGANVQLNHTAGA